MMMFQGYDQQTVDFLWGIRFNNDRSWFQEHKPTCWPPPVRWGSSSTTAFMPCCPMSR